MWTWEQDLWLVTKLQCILYQIILYRYHSCTCMCCLYGLLFRNYKWWKDGWGLRTKLLNQMQFMFWHKNVIIKSNKLQWQWKACWAGFNLAGGGGLELMATCNWHILYIASYPPPLQVITSAGQCTWSCATSVHVYVNTKASAYLNYTYHIPSTCMCFTRPLLVTQKWGNPVAMGTIHTCNVATKVPGSHPANEGPTDDNTEDLVTWQQLSVYFSSVRLVETSSKRCIKGFQQKWNHLVC